MFDKVIEKILAEISQKSVSTEIYPKFSGEGYAVRRIDSKN